jgi:hypothetical protein
MDTKGGAYYHFFHYYTTFHHLFPEKNSKKLKHDFPVMRQESLLVDFVTQVTFRH